MLTSILVFLLFPLVFSQVPPADECQYVGQKEPAECPNHIGPPCPPCLTNSAGEYQNGDPLVLNAHTKQLVQEYMKNNLDYWPANWPPSRAYPKNDPTSIVEGGSGRALIFLRMYNYTQNSSYLNIASEYMDTVKKELARAPAGSASYFVGITGTYIVAAQLAKFQNNANDQNKYLHEIVLIFEDVQKAIDSGSNTSPTYKFDMTDGCLMTGLSGLLYSGMLVNTYFGDNTIGNAYISNLAHYLIALGMKMGKEHNLDYMIFKFAYNSACWLPGSAEGSGGVTKMLLEAYNQGFVPDLLSNATYKSAIENTLNHYVNIQLKDGNIPTYVNEKCASNYGNDPDARVQWCHGAPGFIDTLGSGAVAFDSIGEDTLASKFLNASLMAYNSTWERGLLVKGLMQCHGIGGNAYQLLHVYKNMQVIGRRNSILNTMYDVETLQDQSVWRAIQFVEWTLNDTNLNATRTQYSNEDYSAWLGSYGIPLIYVQAIQNGWPQEVPVCMPGWDFCGV